MTKVVVGPALVILIQIARHLSATNHQETLEKIEVYYLQDLELTQHI